MRADGRATLTERTRSRSSGSVSTRRSRAIFARARQLFVICGMLTRYSRLSSRARLTTHNKHVEVSTLPVPAQVAVRAFLRRDEFDQQRSQWVRLIVQG